MLTAHSTDMYIPKQYLLFVVHHHSPGRLFCTKANGEHMTSLYNREKEVNWMVTSMRLHFCVPTPTLLYQISLAPVEHLLLRSQIC